MQPQKTHITAVRPNPHWLIAILEVFTLPPNLIGLRSDWLAEALAKLMSVVLAESEQSLSGLLGLLGLSSDLHCLPLFIYIGEKFREDRDSNSHIEEADVIKQGNITARQQELA